MLWHQWYNTNYFLCRKILRIFLLWQQKTDNFLLKINCYQEVKIALLRDANLQRLLKN
jgi:hypothetical protein